MKDKIKKFLTKGWDSMSSLCKKAKGRLYEGKDFRAIWIFLGKYGYYAGLVAVLVVLGFVSNAYRNRTVIEPESSMPEPFSVSSVIMPAATENPVSLEAENVIEYIWPVNGGILTQFSDTELIWSETLMQWQTHPAVDISACVGESVIACADGVVKDAYSDPLWGNVIIIGHEDGMESVYANLSTLNLVEEGKVVEKGEVISAVGKSAAAEGEMPWHLHFAFRNENGDYVDFSEYAGNDETEQ